MSRLAVAACVLVAMLSAACEPQRAEKPLQYSAAPNGSAAPVYRLAIHPLYNPQQLSLSYQPLIDYLNRQIHGVQFELEASRDYSAYESKFLDREPAFLLPNPWHTIEAIKVGYHVIAMAGDAADFKGIFIVRKDGGIETPSDLKGKVVSYPSPTALAAAIMPQYYLHHHGIDTNRDIRNIYVGSQESSIMNVYMGKAAAGATWPPPWRLFQKDHPHEAAQLKMAWETPPLINNSVMARDDVPEDIRDQVKNALIDLGSTAQGKRILAGMETSGFQGANDASYDVVRKYIRIFEQEVRPVAKK